MSSREITASVASGLTCCVLGSVLAGTVAALLLMLLVRILT